MTIERRPVPLKERLRKSFEDLKIDFGAFVLNDPYARMHSRKYRRRYWAKRPGEYEARREMADMTPEELEKVLEG